MKTIMTLEYAFDILDLKKYIKEDTFEDNLELEEIIVNYFENELGLPIRDFENFDKIVKNLIDILQ